MPRLVWTCLLLSLANANSAADQECRPLRFDQDSVVCACDAGYCDHSEPELPSAGQYLTVTSDRDGLRFKKKYGYIDDYNDICDDCNNCKLDLNRQRLSLEIKPTNTFQRILGFGGAFTDASGMNILDLTPDVQDKLMRAYFGKSGLDYTMGRVPIGGTDFSPRAYTYDDLDSDGDLRHFALQLEDYKYKIPFILKAQELATEELLLASATWSPPVFMKNNHKFLGRSHLKKEYYELYAQYHVRFLQEYRKHGIEFWSISTGNEPTNGLSLLSDNGNSCGWLPDDMAEWIIHNFGPAIRTSEFNNTKILFLDDSRHTTLNFLSTLLKHKDVERYMDGIALHWYFDDIINTKELDKVLKKRPQLQVYTTEMSLIKDGIKMGAWSRAEKYTQRIIGEMNHTSAFIDWNLALDAATGGYSWSNPVTVEALIFVDKQNNRFFKQPSYYAFGHFSKYIPRGSYRVQAKETTRSDLDYAAFLRPDGFVVVIMLNSQDHNVYASVDVDNKGTINMILSPKSVTTLLC